MVIATEKKLPSPLVDESSMEKIQMYTDSIGVVYSGMGPDFRVMVRQGQKKAAAYKLQYGVRGGGRAITHAQQQPTLGGARANTFHVKTHHSNSPPSHPPPHPLNTPQETIPVLQLVRELAAVMQEYTQSGGVRPFGISLLIGGVDDEGPALYQVDPSGAYFGWRATAIGKNFINAKTFLEKRYSEGMELEDAIHTALLTLREGFEGEMTKDNIEVGIVGADRKFRVLTPSEVADYLQEAE